MERRVVQVQLSFAQMLCGLGIGPPGGLHQRQFTTPMMDERCQFFSITFFSATSLLPHRFSPPLFFLLSTLSRDLQPFDCYITIFIDGRKEALLISASVRYRLSVTNIYLLHHSSSFYLARSNDGNGYQIYGTRKYATTT